MKGGGYERGVGGGGTQRSRKEWEAGGQVRDELVNLFMEKWGFKYTA